MEISKQALWMRITGWNSVNNEVQENVGNGKLTGSVRKETVAVSDTTWMSVQNRHCRIRLRILSCSRMSENHREPEVPEVKVPVVECLDGFARITSKELAPLHSVKNGILQNACSTSPKIDAGLWKSALMRIARLTNSLAKGFKKNGDKSAVAMLNITRQLGCVFQDMELPKSSSILRKSSNILKPIRCVRFTEAISRDQNPSLGMICPQSSSAHPQRSKIWVSVSRRDGMARAMCPRSSVEAGQEYA